MRVVVTGGTGFIGRKLLDYLIAGQHKILVLVRSSSEIPLCWGTNNIDICFCDLSDRSSFVETMAHFEPDIAIHLAWEGIPDFSFKTCLTNVNSLSNFIDAVCQMPSCTRILVSGSCLEYGCKGKICDESDLCIPFNDFTWAKNTIRELLEFKCSDQKIQFGWLRLFYVYGPGQREGALIPHIIKSLQINGVTPQIKNPHGANDFIYVDDVARAIRNLVEAENFRSGIVNLGSGRGIRVGDVCLAAQSLFANGVVNHIPEVAVSDLEATGCLVASRQKAVVLTDIDRMIGIEEGLVSMFNCWSTDVTKQFASNEIRG